jgi:hypothetical protein
MLLEELYNDNKPLNEFNRPYGMVQNAKDTVSSAVKGVFGGGQKEQGNKDAGTMANDYFKAFKQYAGTQGAAGKSMIDVKILKDWVKGMGIDYDVDIPDGRPITPKEAADQVLKATRAKLSYGSLTKPNDKVKPQEQKQQTQEEQPKRRSSNILDKINQLSPEEKQELADILRQ